MKRLLFIFILCALITQAAAEPDAVLPGQSQTAEVTLYALRYAQSDFPGKQVFWGGEGVVELAWMFWVIRDGTETYLVDAGIRDERLVRGFKLRDYVDPLALLERLELCPRDVTAIILTHLHADHADGCKAFPDTPVLLQKQEYDAVAKAMAAHPDRRLNGGCRRDDFSFIEKQRQAGLVRLLEGDVRIAPHVSAELAPYHTAGTQSVIVDTPAKRFLLVPDNAYVTRNVSDARPVGIVRDLEGNRAFLEKLRGLDASKNVIVPGHEPDVFSCYRRVADGIVQLSPE